MNNLQRIESIVRENQKEMEESTEHFFANKKEYIFVLNQANEYVNSINIGLREIKEQDKLSKEDQKKYDIYIKPKEEIITKIKETIQYAMTVYINIEKKAVDLDNGVDETRHRVDTYDNDLVLLSIQNNDQVLREKKRKLIEVKQLAAQIKEFKDSIKYDTVEHGEDLKQIEQYAPSTEDNITSAKIEIEIANEISQKNNKKCYCTNYFLLV